LELSLSFFKRSSPLIVAPDLVELLPLAAALAELGEVVDLLFVGMQGLIVVRFTLVATFLTLFWIELAQLVEGIELA
jgi:hypothetical protein